jgi:hypothetical protein
MSRNKKTVVAVLVAIGIAAVAYALLPAGPDPDVVRVQQMQERLFDMNAKMSDDDRMKGFRELGEASRNLTDEQRMQVMRENPMAKRMRQSVVDYFNLPEKDRVALLDKHIDEMEKMRKDFAKRMKDRQAKGGGGPGGFGGRGGGPPGGGPGGPRGPGGPGGDRNEMRKKMLDNTSPQERAMFSEYFQQMSDRRKERGLPPLGGPFGGR